MNRFAKLASRVAVSSTTGRPARATEQLHTEIVIYIIDSLSHVKSLALSHLKITSIWSEIHFTKSNPWLGLAVKVFVQRKRWWPCVQLSCLDSTPERCSPLVNLKLCSEFVVKNSSTWIKSVTHEIPLNKNAFTYSQNTTNKNRTKFPSQRMDPDFQTKDTLLYSSPTFTMEL